MKEIKSQDENVIFTTKDTTSLMAIHGRFALCRPDTTEGHEGERKELIFFPPSLCSSWWKYLKYLT